MADNRVVIKINYDSDKHRKALIDPKMVTVWHTPRILAVLGIVLLILAGIWFWFSKGASQPSEPAVVTQVPTSPAPLPVTTPADTAAKVEVAAPVSQTASNASKSPNVKRPSAIIFDRRVIRASLNTAPRNNEPGDPIESPVMINDVAKIDVFYFSQIKNLQGQGFFHKWRKDGKLAFKKQFIAKSNNERLISSMKLTPKDVGEWQVMLVDKTDKVLSEVNFSVKP